MLQFVGSPHWSHLGLQETRHLDFSMAIHVVLYSDQIGLDAAAWLSSGASQAGYARGLHSEGKPVAASMGGKAPDPG